MVKDMTETKRGPGQPPHAPTSQQRKMVESMSAYGIPQDDISKVIGISIDTLAKHYREELDTATAKANAKVAETLYRQATNADNPRSATAAIFWLKTRGGWKETSVHEHGGIGGGPIQSEDVTHGAESFAQRMARLAAASVPASGTGETDGDGEG